MRQLESQKVVNAIAPIAQTAGTVNGTGIDTTGFTAVSFALALGAVNAGSTPINLKIQESDDNSAWSDVDGAAIVALTGADGESGKIPTIDLLLSGLTAPHKRYVRPVLVIGGVGSSLIGVTALMLGKEAPVTQDIASVFA